MMNHNQELPPNDAVNSTGIPGNIPNMHPVGVRIIRPTYRQINAPGAERRVVIVRGDNRIPAVPSFNNATPRKSVAVKVEQLDKEIKEEPLDEEAEYYGGKANITSSKPINVRDLMSSSSSSYPMLREEDIKKEASPPLVLHLKTRESDAPSSSSSSQLPIAAALQNMDKANLKRTRKSGRRDDFVYDNPEFQEEEHESSPEPPSKNKKASNPTDGCRCEYIVPELDSKMDRIMDKMSFIETLAKSMLVKEESVILEKTQAKESLAKAQNEIQQLRRQLILQRNHSVTRPDNNTF